MRTTFVTSLENILAPAHTSSEERRKRLYLALCLIAALPLVTVLGIVDLAAHRTAEGLSILLVCALLLLCLVALPRIRHGLWVFRFATFVVLTLLVIEVAIGGGSGASFMWFYVFPNGVFYIFGTREGSLWVGSSLALAAKFLLGADILGTFAYSTATVTRFLITYGVVSFFSFGLEASRSRFYRELLAEKEALQKAAQQIRKLSGLLPICASCKRIRDDQGRWTQLESFISIHSEAQFSHGLCPDCCGKLYPDMPASE